MAKPIDQPDPDQLEESQSRMSFGEHLEELRKRIMRALFGSLPIIAVCIVFYKEIVRFIVEPYRVVAEAHHMPPFLLGLKPQEAFLTSITLAFQAGLLLSSPWIIYQLWQFVAAGLYQRERRIVYRYTAPSALLFLGGVAFFYFIVLPMTLSFFIGFTANTAGPPPRANFIERFLHIGAPTPATAPATGPSTATAAATAPALQPVAIPSFADDPPAPPPGQTYLYHDERDGGIKARTGDEIVVLMVAPQSSLFTTTWRFDDYLSFVTFTALVFGLAFELPMVILVLAQTGIVETQTFRNVRKYAYFVILISAAIAAPAGDLTTLFFLTVPLIGLYEFGIVAAAIAVRRQERRLADE